MNTNQKILMPTPSRYTIRYRTARNEIKVYEISTPIEKFPDRFVAYSFTSRGIRSFKVDGILEIN